MNSELRAAIRTIEARDPDFPDALRNIPDSPERVYVLGRWPLPENRIRIGIVGARQASAYGLDAAKRLSTDLAAQGIITISGMAKGIDAAAHHATLEANGWTVGVLGHGLGFRYPAENKALYERMVEGGTLVTEFPYSTSPLPALFPQRNRIISGLSQGVLVVEAGEKSGALITARCAAEQGRDVFAVPGSLFSSQCRGSNRLIKEGAKLVESAEDILSEYGAKAPVRSTLKVPQEELSTEEAALLKHIELSTLSLDEMIEITGQSVEQLAALLLSLELKGRISPMPGQLYVARY